jgi:putative flavoprotein involved in K+ transport
MSRYIDTVIGGGGQAGLAISYYLSQQGREHVVLERASAVANAWRNQRWDSFTLVTPNFQVRMPGAEYKGSDPYGFMSLAEVVRYFDDYVERFHLPVHCQVEVFSVEKIRDGYLVRTSEGDYTSENVVIATGLYQSPKISEFSRALPADILQIHSMEYRNPCPCRTAQYWLWGPGNPAPRSRKSCTKAEEKSISRSAAPVACLDAIAERTSMIGLSAWACLTPKSKS